MNNLNRLHLDASTDLLPDDVRAAHRALRALAAHCTTPTDLRSLVSHRSIARAA